MLAHLKILQQHHYIAKIFRQHHLSVKILRRHHIIIVHLEKKSAAQFSAKTKLRVSEFCSRKVSYYKQWWCASDIFLTVLLALLEFPSCRGKCPGRTEPDRSHRTPAPPDQTNHITFDESFFHFHLLFSCPTSSIHKYVSNSPVIHH